MRTRHTDLLALLLTTVLAFCAASVVACDGDDDDAPVATPTSAASPAVSPTAPEQPTATAEPSPVAGEPTPTATTDAGAGAAAEAARSALISWLGPVADPAALELQEAEAMTWADGCLELSRAGQVCTQALVEGFRFRFTIGKATYEVRSDAEGNNVRWAPQVMVLVRFSEASTNILEFTSDDGGTIVAQAVPGTDFGLDVNSLQQGDPVGIALVDAPQADHFLLVWLDPP